MLTQERLKQLLDYSPDTGLFLWRVERGHGGGKPGDIAGHKHSQGYTALSIDGRTYKQHRLAWLYIHGHFPDGEIDHINLNKSDNRISNLRRASRSQNRSNVRAYRNSKSGIKGVSLHGMTGRWQVSISVKGKQHYLGLFDDIGAASAAYAKAAQRLHGNFARTA